MSDVTALSEIAPHLTAVDVLAPDIYCSYHLFNIIVYIKGSLWCSKRMLYLGTRQATPVEGAKTDLYQINSSRLLQKR